MTTSRFLVEFLCYGTIPVFVATVAMAFSVALGGPAVRKDEGVLFAAAGGATLVAMLFSAMIVAFFAGMT